MMMAMRPVHMTMRDLFATGGAHLDHIERKAQRDAGQRMVAIQDDLAIGNVGHGKYA